MNEFKFRCSQCSRLIQCDTSYAGTQINCPSCKKTILVPQPDTSAPAGQPPGPKQARTWRNYSGIAAAAIVLAALATAAWFGYSKIKYHKFAEQDWLLISR
jgi:DNA-directed RNA polymerase subunit RPC12/RpoP